MSNPNDVYLFPGSTAPNDVLLGSNALPVLVGPGVGALVLVGFAPLVRAIAASLTVPAGGVMERVWRPKPARELDLVPFPRRKIKQPVVQAVAQPAASPVAITTGTGVLVLESYAPTVEVEDPSAYVVAESEPWELDDEAMLVALAAYDLYFT